MILHIGQHLLPVGRVGKNARNGHGTRHRTIDHEKVLLSLSCRCSWHDLYPLLHQAGNSLSDAQLGASHLRRQRRNRAAGVGMVTVLG